MTRVALSDPSSWPTVAVAEMTAAKGKSASPVPDPWNCPLRNPMCRLQAFDGKNGGSGSLKADERSPELAEHDRVARDAAGGFLG